jgi:hypothetical protein
MAEAKDNKHYKYRQEIQQVSHFFLLESQSCFVLSSPCHVHALL